MKGLCCGCIVVAAVASAELHHRNPPLLTDNSLLHPTLLPAAAAAATCSIVGRGWPHCKIPPPIIIPPIHYPKRERCGEELE